MPRPDHASPGPRPTPGASRPTAGGGHDGGGGLIHGLDAVRFSAALAVVVYHLAHRAWAPPPIGDGPAGADIRDFIPDSPAFPHLEPVVWFGWVGVQLFFVLSGFVIALSAEGSSPYAFLRGRVVRLAPGVLVCATITALVVAAVEGPTLELANRTLRTLALPVFLDGPWVDSVYWTLAVEVAFYAAVFLALSLDRFRHADLLAAALVAVSGGAWLAWALTGEGDWRLGTAAAKLLLVRHGCFFAAGLLLWLLMCKRDAPAWRVGLRVALLAAALSAGLAEIAHLTAYKEGVLGRPFPTEVAQLVFLGGVLAIVLSVRFNAALRRRLGAGRWAGRLRTVGMATFALYLVHNMVGVALMTALEDAMGRHLALAASVSAMVLLALAVATLAEPPLARRVPAGLDRLAAHAHRRARPTPAAAWAFRPTRPVEA